MKVRDHVPPGAHMSLSAFEPVLFVKREQPRGKQLVVLHLPRKAQKEKTQQPVVSPKLTALTGGSNRRDDSRKLSGYPGLSFIP